MEASVVVAVISGAVALGSAGFTAVLGRRVQADTARLNDALESDRIRLKHRLDLEATARARTDAAADLVVRYRDPLLRAAHDLQSRLYNIVAQDFLGVYHDHPDADIREYAVDNTLFVLAEYLGWSEIVRREIQFLDLADEAVGHELNARLMAVSHVLSTDSLPPVFRLFRGQQRAIGEIVTVTRSADADKTGPRSETLGYAAFVARRPDEAFARWFDRLRKDIGTLATGSGSSQRRLIELQRSLVDVMDLLDPECRRIPSAQRGTLSSAGPFRPPRTLDDTADTARPPLRGDAL